MSKKVEVSHNGYGLVGYCPTCGTVIGGHSTRIYEWIAKHLVTKCKDK